MRSEERAIKENGGKLPPKPESVPET